MTVFRVGLAVVLFLVLGCDENEPAPWQNHPPWPPVVDGPDSTWVGFAAQFHITVGDPDGHAMVVYVSWGDGDTADYGEFVPSGATVTFEHAWSRPDTFLVAAGCYDTYSPSRPLVSDWSASKPVVVRRPAATTRLTAERTAIGFR